MLSHSIMSLLMPCLTSPGADRPRAGGGRHHRPGPTEHPAGGGDTAESGYHQVSHWCLEDDILLVDRKRDDIPIVE